MSGTQWSSEDTWSLLFFLSIVKKKKVKTHNVALLCLELSGQFVWEEAEEVQYVASYLERGHLAWCTDNSPTAQRAAVSQVLRQTLPWEPGEWDANKKSVWEREGEKKMISCFSPVWVCFASSAFSFNKALRPDSHVGTASMWCWIFSLNSIHSSLQMLQAEKMQCVMCRSLLIPKRTTDKNSNIVKKKKKKNRIKR